MRLLSPKRKNISLSIFASVLVHGIGISLMLNAHYGADKGLMTLVNQPDQVDHNERQWVSLSMLIRPLKDEPLISADINERDRADQNASALGLVENVDLEEIVDVTLSVSDTEDSSFETSESVARGEGAANEEDVRTQERGGVSVHSIQGSVNQFMHAQRSQLQQDWLQECWYQRNPLRTVEKECDEDSELIASPLEQHQEAAEIAFASINRPQQQRRIIQQLDRANAALARLKDDDIVGGLASRRSRINQQQLAYLTGNFNDNYWNFVQISQAVDPQVGFLRYLGVPTCKRGDCIFEYTDPRGNREVAIQKDGFRVLRQNFPLVFDSESQAEAFNLEISDDVRILQRVMQETDVSEIEGVEVEGVELSE